MNMKFLNAAALAPIFIPVFFFLCLILSKRSTLLAVLFLSSRDNNIDKNVTFFYRVLVMLHWHHQRQKVAVMILTANRVVLEDYCGVDVPSSLAL